MQKYGREPISLHTRLGEDGDSEFGDLIEDSEAIQPGEAVSFTLLQDQLHSVLDTLSEREAGVVSMRFGLTDGQPKTLDEIGKVYGVTRGSARSSPRPCRSCGTNPGPTSSGTTSTDLTDGRQPQDVASHPRPARDAQNAQIRTASIATGIEPYSAQIGGYTSACSTQSNYAS